VVGGVWKKCEKLKKKKKKKVVKIFWTEILEVGLRVLKKVAKYSGQPRPETNFSVCPWGGAKFISSPWAQKWLATALTVMRQLHDTSYPGFKQQPTDGTINPASIANSRLRVAPPLDDAVNRTRSPPASLQR
jgi:hypothetical protein